MHLAEASTRRAPRLEAGFYAREHTIAAESADRGLPRAGAWLARNLQFVRAHLATADLRTLALLRVVLGVLLVADLWHRIGLVETLYSNDGVLSNHFSLFRPLAQYQFSLYAAFSSSRDVTVAFVLTLVIYVLFMVGYRTRLFHLLAFIGVTSLHARNLMTELPSDALFHVLLGWSLFLPLGARFSIDSVRQSLTSRREQSVEELNAPARHARTVTSLAVLGLLLQISAVHLTAALRQSGPAWQDGTAFYYALRQNLWATDIGTFIGDHASFESIRAASILYRVIEFVIGIAVLVPRSAVRRASLFLILAFHLVSRMLWNFGPYEWAMAGTAVFLVSSRDWDALRSFYERRKRALTIELDTSSGLGIACCRMLKRLDPLARLTFAAAQNHAAGTPPATGGHGLVVVRDEAGAMLSGSRAVAAIVGSLPLGAPLRAALRMPSVSSLCDRALSIVSRRQEAIGAWFGLRGFPPHGSADPVIFDDSIARRLARFRTLAREGAAVAALVICSVALLRDMDDNYEPSGLEHAIYKVVAYPRLFQRWGLFAPEPPRSPGRVVAEGRTVGGARLDPFTGKPSSATPSGGAGARRQPANPLMNAYFASIAQPSRSVYVGELRDYLRRIGEKRGSTDNWLWFNVDWVEVPIPPPEDAPRSSLIAVASPPRRITSGP